MGDRANFGIRQKSGDIIFVYGHWAGEGMMKRFAHAVSRVVQANHQHDEAYANRIIISDLVDDHDSNFSWGVTVNYIVDSEHSIPVVNFDDNEFTLYKAEWGAESLGESKFTLPIDSFLTKYQ